MGKGSYRFKAFRLSEMMPNSWLYKLRDMGSRVRRGTRGSRKVQNSIEKRQVPLMEAGKSIENLKPSPKPPQNQAYIGNRPSYYIPSQTRVDKLPYPPTNPKATDTPLPLAKPRRTKTKPRKKPLSTHNKLISSPVSSFNTETPPLHHLDNIFNDESITSDYNLPIPLPPIVTKPIKKETTKPNLNKGNQSAKQRSNMRRSTPQTPRIKMRLNSPRIVKKRLREKRGLADSFVVVKSSSDPQSDFRESMLEMIIQNNLWASKDLEELLSCYLYLNSDEYHDLIVKAFKQIWFDLTVINLQYK